MLIPAMAVLQPILSLATFVNDQPAARIGDAIDCGGTLAAGSPDIAIG